MQITTLKLIFAVDYFFDKRDAEKVRGFLGDIFWENPIVHHHNPDGSLLYSYPRLQYKVIDGNCLIVSFDEGIDTARKIFDELQKINISSNWLDIHSKALKLDQEDFGETDLPFEYKFVTPWLALNEENFAKYKEARSFQNRKWLLENILTANLISIAKSLGYTVQKNIHASFSTLKPIDVNIKDTRFAGFFGSFSVNFNIPSFWGVGKSVAKGFGTIIKKEDLSLYRDTLFKLFPEPNKKIRSKSFRKKYGENS